MKTPELIKIKPRFTHIIQLTEANIYAVKEYLEQNYKSSTPYKIYTNSDDEPRGLIVSSRNSQWPCDINDLLFLGEGEGVKTMRIHNYPPPDAFYKIEGVLRV